MKLSKNVRDAVRAMVRNHPGFDTFRAANGDFASRDLTTELTLKAAAEFGLMDEVRDLVRNEPESAAPESAAPETQTAPESVSAPDLGESVLGPLRPFLSPTLLDTVASALAPIVMAALKPPVEITKTVLVDESGVAVAAPESEDAIRTRETTFGALWNAKRHKHASLPVGVWVSDDMPALDPYFVADNSVLAKLTRLIENKKNFWLAGPAGSGKTTLPTQYAARTGRPFVRLAMNRTTDPVDLLGSDSLKNDAGVGVSKWRDGVLTRAIRKPGTIILIDEICACPPGIAMTFQTLLDHRYLTLPTGERVECAEGVTFCAADNTRGYGDESGLYGGTQQANAALVDRFAVMLWVDYMSPAMESQALANHTLAPKAACERVVQFVNSARKLSGFDARPLSLRRMTAFVDMCAGGFDINESFDDCVLSRMPDAERETLRQHFAAAFALSDFRREMGEDLAKNPPQSDAPQQVAARASFPDLAE